MKIIALMENTAAVPEVLSEHGLSLYLEGKGHRILFDTGQSENFAVNAERLGVDLSAVDLAIISHGHYDHGGGLKRFLELNQKAPVYLSAYAFEPHFNGAKDIGIDPGLRESGRLRFVKEKTVLDEGLELYPRTEFKPQYPVCSRGLKTLREGKQVDEDFRHEQYLLIREGTKKILISGCSHAGILNIAVWFRPDVLAGGFHLKDLDPQGEGKAALEQTAEVLKSFQTVYFTCHCTGTAQYAYLKEKMGDQLHYLPGGASLTL